MSFFLGSSTRRQSFTNVSSLGKLEYSVVDNETTKIEYRKHVPVPPKKEKATFCLFRKRKKPSTVVVWGLLFRPRRSSIPSTFHLRESMRGLIPKFSAVGVRKVVWEGKK